jgi:hypothetical protein
LRLYVYGRVGKAAEPPGPMATRAYGKGPHQILDGLGRFRSCDQN